MRLGLGTAQVSGELSFRSLCFLSTRGGSLSWHKTNEHVLAYRPHSDNLVVINQLCG